MIRVKLKSRRGDERELNLPLTAEDATQRNIESYAAFGTASIDIDTPSKELGEKIKRCIPNEIEGGIAELNILATVLEKMNGEQLRLLERDLTPDVKDYDEMMRRTLYNCSHAFYSNGSENPHARPLDEYDMDLDKEKWAARTQRNLNEKIDAYRVTGADLFDKVLDAARSNGDMDRYSKIAEYELSEDQYTMPLTNYEFDLLPVINFGCEGVYVDCSIQGDFGHGNRSLNIGTIKTLADDLDACKTMGELCGALIYHENRVVNSELERYAPIEEIENSLSHSLKVEQAPKMQNDMSMQL